MAPELAEDLLGVHFGGDLSPWPGVGAPLVPAAGSIYRVACSAWCGRGPDDAGGPAPFAVVSFGLGRRSCRR